MYKYYQLQFYVIFESMIKSTEKGIIINLRISPNSKKNEIINQNGEIKIKIAAQPIDGKANKCLIEYLSKIIKTPKTSIKIIKGETSKDKTILIDSIDKEITNKINELFT